MKKDIRIRLLSREELMRLSERYGAQRAAVSLYLGVRAGQDFRVAANSALSTAERQSYGKGFDIGEQARLLGTIRALGEYLRTLRLPDRTRSFVIFATDEAHLEIFRLPGYLPTHLYLGRGITVHPLLRTARKYPRYAVLVLERDRAQLYEIVWGELEAESAPIRSEVPQRMNPARTPNRGVDERRVRGHIEDHIQRHLKKVAAATGDFMAEHETEHLVIGSRRELLGRFRALLPRALQERIAGSFAVRSDESRRLLRERSLAVVRAHEEAGEERLAAALAEGSSKKLPGAALGTEAALRALGEYRVRLLVLGKHYAPAGYRCAPCGQAAWRAGRCRECGGRLRPAEDLTEELTALALEQEVRIVHFLFEHPEFDRHGVGVLLR